MCVHGGRERIVLLMERYLYPLCVSDIAIYSSSLVVSRSYSSRSGMFIGSNRAEIAFFGRLE